ncbi:S-locus receptor kinase [Dorcoceras hygrometricum]|uniref:S-locus receptor kinase n=1 Tax=Dorcoceras hygrometricum TaxID=472368 RepID=A0A2Z7B8C7_9LAMI|nr:S-locus receptor kinase [Dorcoceras hygrometricum]
MVNLALKVNPNCEAASKNDIISERCTGLVRVIAAKTQLMCLAWLNTAKASPVSFHPISPLINSTNHIPHILSTFRDFILEIKSQSAQSKQITAQTENQQDTDITQGRVRYSKEDEATLSISMFPMLRDSSQTSSKLTPAQLSLLKYAVNSNWHDKRSARTLSCYSAQNIQLDSKLKAQLIMNHSNKLPNQIALLSSQEPKDRLISTSPSKIPIPLGQRQHRPGYIQTFLNSSGAQRKRNSRSRGRSWHQLNAEPISVPKKRSRNLIWEDFKGYRTTGMSPTPSHKTYQHNSELSHGII